jgi:hypothetical protein
MLDSGFVDVAIGLMLVYFLLALVCSGINELVEALLRRRAKYLEGGIVDLLGIDLKQQLYEHSLLEGLYPQRGRPISDESVPDAKRKKPSYIPSATFAHALASILTDGSARLTGEVDGATETVPVDSTIGFRAGNFIQVHLERMRIEEVLDRALRVTRAHNRSLGPSSCRTNPRPHCAKDRGSIQPSSAGSQETPWACQTAALYGRRTRWWLFAYGIVIVVVLNADTALVARTLWSDATLRGSVVAQAGSVVAGGETREPCEDPACIATRLKRVKALGLPLGWPDLRVGDWGDGVTYADDDRVPHSTPEGVLKFFGLLLTAAALALGAPFWFDLLNKVTNFRASGRPPPSTQEPGSSAVR